MMERPVYSIVAPVYNEEGNIEALFDRVSGVMDALHEPWELIIVNDGSRDSSLAQMRELQAAHPHVRVISFSRNFGHQIAVTAGLDHAAGQAAILIDADLQDPPEIIPEMIAHWKQGYDVVYAIREERAGESWFKISDGQAVLPPDLPYRRNRDSAGYRRLPADGPAGGECPALHARAQPVHPGHDELGGLQADRACGMCVRSAVGAKPNTHCARWCVSRWTPSRDSRTFRCKSRCTSAWCWPSSLCWRSRSWRCCA